MEKTTTILIPNTGVKLEGDFDEILEAQDIMNDPVVLVVESRTNKLLHHFVIEAEDMKDLTYMYERKIFYTSSINEGSHMRCLGALFLGVPAGYYKRKRRSAATERHGKSKM
ncbi:hypothetical protein V7201_10725 [Bacillus sp. JJ1122]|uniref:hypothetical protein n=1 Tax=Bacillus sp. JJ1122 TaxID=3122951 RepID=UPI00300040DA